MLSTIFLAPIPEAVPNAIPVQDQAAATPPNIQPPATKIPTAIHAIAIVVIFLAKVLFKVLIAFPAESFTFVNIFLLVLIPAISHSLTIVTNSPYGIFKILSNLPYFKNNSGRSSNSISLYNSTIFSLVSIYL